MCTRPKLPYAAAVCLFCLTLILPVQAEGQLPSPARDAAEELVAVLDADDEKRLRAFVETRFSPRLRARTTMEGHLEVLASVAQDIEGMEVDGLELHGPFGVTLILEGRGRRLLMQLAVEEDEPHRITGIEMEEPGPALGATSLGDLGVDLDRLASEDAFSGVVLIARSGSILFHEAFGDADRASGRPNRRGTRFDLGSINKLFTSTVILRLIEEGRLDLDATIGAYLEGFPAEVAGGVTILHLLQHRSGYGDYLYQPWFEADPRRFRAPADFLPYVRGQELAFEPGARRRYSNLGFVLLGAIIERVTGREYHEAVHDLVFAPAGMETAGMGGGAESARRYHLMPEGFVEWDRYYPEIGSPAGGGYGAAIDLLRYIEALLDYRLLSEEGTRVLLNDFRRPSEGGALPERFGFSGGAAGVNASLLVEPEERRAVIVLANIDSFAAEGFAGRLLELVDP